jgi:Spirocyclase AveC-like
VAIDVQRHPAAVDELGSAPARQADVAVPRTLPIKIWASLGALCLAFAAYVMIRWVTGPDFKQVHTGPTPVPQWMKTEIDIYIPLGLAACVFSIYWFLVRPWLRNRQVTTDGLLVLMWIVMYFNDPVTNVFNHWFAYNSYLTNFGSWVTSIPGWNSTDHGGATTVEPFLMMLPAYIYYCFPATVLACWMLRRAQSRWNLSNFWIVMMCFALMTTWDVVMELPWTRMGLYTYPGSIRSLTLWPGHYYRYPLYQGLFWGAAWAGFTCLRYFKNDKGETWAERGLSEITGGPLKKLGLRFLALVGAGFVCFTVGFNIPAVFASMKTDGWPKDIQKRSYLTDGLCGPGTSYACPGANVPIAKRGAAFFDPSGRVVIPAHALKPGTGRLNTGTLTKAETR